MIKVGLIGLGYWGPNLARVLQQTPECDFTCCCDLDPVRLQRTVRQYPQLSSYDNVDDFLNADIGAVLIATPISTHYGIAHQALARGKHVFVEKPLADSSARATELVALARREGRTLMTGHTFIYSPAVVKVRELIEAGALGAIHYVSFSRVNLGLYQKDVDVVWDLAVHDISILLYWLNEFPVDASCFGRSCIQQSKRDVAFLWFKFPSGIVASCEVSWLSPQKMRRICIVGSERMVVYDDTEPSEKIKIYDRGVVMHTPSTFGEFQLTYRMGDVVSPNLDNREPLVNEIEHFVKCIETGSMPRTDGRFGVNVVKAIEMANDAPWLPTGQEQDLAQQLAWVQGGAR
jgi:predicted dehydrogenase